MSSNDNDIKKSEKYIVSHVKRANNNILFIILLFVIYIIILAMFAAKRNATKYDKHCLLKFVTSYNVSDECSKN